MKKLAAFTKETFEEDLKNNLAQNTNVAKSQREYNTQLSEEKWGRKIKELSKKFSRTESRILGVLSRSDTFPESATPRPLRICSGDIPKPTQYKPGTK